MYKRKLTLWLNDWIISLVTFEVSSKQLNQHSLIMECEECDDLWKKNSLSLEVASTWQESTFSTGIFLNLYT